ncbi:hypothetical protein C8J56DRAFT_933571 [Mycena floridula]|nr:hypothetical protein C8J56DRAFT_933571 [Mycena floridula]
MSDLSPNRDSAEPTFIRPAQPSAQDALRRLSVQTTRSWIPPTPQTAVPPPISKEGPSRGPSIRHSVALHTTNPDIVNDPSEEEEFMNIQAESTVGLPSEYRNGKAKLKKSGRPFVGGFFSGLRRLPRALKHGKEPAKQPVTHTTEAAGNIALPAYASNPPTPTVPPPVTAHLEQSTERILPPSLLPGGTRHPSFRITAPVEENPRLSRLVDSAVIFPQPEPYDRTTLAAEPTPIPLPSSPHPTRTPTRTPRTERSVLLTPHSENHPSIHDNDERPVSVDAHPQPARDYRRMSKAHTRTHNSASSMSSSEPSFSEELNGVVRFFSNLKSMPWVASERITEDYRPGLGTASWAWKRVSVRKNERRNGNRKSTAKKRLSLRPVQKPLSSWYTSLGGRKAGGTVPALPSWAGSPANREDVLDLLSSGTGTRSSALSGSSRATQMSSPGLSPILPRNRHGHRRPAAHSSPPKTSRKRREHEPRSHERSRHRSRRHEGYRESTPPLGYPSPTYGYPQYQYSPVAPVAQVPLVVPQNQMYILHSPPPGSVQGDNLGSDHPELSPQGSPQPLASTYYMPVLASPLLQHHLAPVSEGSEGSPPGLAGRGTFPPAPTFYQPGYGHGHRYQRPNMASRNDGPIS